MIRSASMILALTTLVLGISPRPTTAQHFVPIKGSYVTAFTLTPTPTPGVVRVQIVSIGKASHLGNSTNAADTLVDMRVVPNLQTGPELFIAANGDRLAGTYSGIAGLPDPSGIIRFSGILTFTGGTGRFSEATGSAVLQGTANVINGTGQFSFAGQIALK
jgi:hypothetical protein